MNDIVIIIALAIAAVLGAVAVAESKGRNWAGWACLIGFGVLLVARLT